MKEAEDLSARAPPLLPERKSARASCRLRAANANTPRDVLIMHVVRAAHATAPRDCRERAWCEPPFFVPAIVIKPNQSSSRTAIASAEVRKGAYSTCTLHPWAAVREAR